MLDYKRAFNKVVEKLDIYWECLPLRLNCDTTENSITEEEHDLFAECFCGQNLEPDNLEKILTDFRTIGWDTCDTIKAIERLHVVFLTKIENGYKKTLELYSFGYVYKDDSKYNLSLKISEIRLINRMLRLWGVEV